MTRRAFRIEEYAGIDESRGENSLPGAFSPDACNMDTENGELAVAKGYVRHISAAISSSASIIPQRLRRFRSAAGDQLAAVCGSSIMIYRDGSWSRITAALPNALGHVDFTQARIGATDYLLIATGEGQIMKYGGSGVASNFGSTAGLSDIAVNYLAMYKSRLFSAGDWTHPNRLYWSQLPGGTRSIENWGPDTTSVNVEGGHAEVGAAGGDPITGLVSLSNQLLIFKSNSLYRLIGDKPSNFIIEELSGNLPATRHTALVKVGDVVYFMTQNGMYAYNGVSAQPMGDARCIQRTLRNADFSDCRGACAGDKLYFSFREGTAQALIEYDMRRRTYMLRRGFNFADLAAWDETLFLLGPDRCIYRFNEGDTYGGAPITAWWVTPLTDAGDKGAVKAMREMYLRGASAGGAALLADVTVGATTTTHRLLLPETLQEVAEVPLGGEGRTFQVKLYNEAGGHFRLSGGMELLFEQWRRVE